MSAHLPLHRLEPGARLEAADRAHLDGCPRCRVERRLLGGFFEEPGLPEAELSAANTLLDGVRSQLTGSIVQGTLLDEGTFAHELEGPPTDVVPAPEQRYRVLGTLGAGGMGEVLAVHDRTLERGVAMKVASPDLQANRRAMARFVEEAQVGAQLQHPGIVPVHDLGRLPDGRAFFTMKEVDGVTLAEASAGVHLASRDGRWEESATGWTFRRLVEAVRRVAETVAYAHARGVAHRDLKPANVMLGGWGEVLVVDWGLAKVMGASGEIASPRQGDEALATRMGSVAGTPSFMAPEQARAEQDAIGPPADVYALGALLRTLLTGRPPYVGISGADVLAQVLAGPPGPMEARGGPLPGELVEACERAMAREIGERTGSAGEFADAVGAWLDGAARRDKALAALREAEGALPRIRQAREEAAALEERAEAALAPTRSFDPEERKREGWRLQDEARARREAAHMLELQFTEGVRSALVHDPELPEAHRALAAFHRAEHERAERAGEAAAAARSEVLLRAHDDGTHADYLRGVGWLSLRTEPRARARLRRVESRERKLVAGEVVAEVASPLERRELPVGSWLIELSAQGRAEVRLPVVIERGREHEGEPVRLPGGEELGAGEVFVPAGWFRSGGDKRAPSSLPERRVWLDDFVIRRDPVTHAEYLAFLDALVGAGREDEALRYAPRERPGKPGELGALLVAHVPGVGFRLREDAEGDTWEADWPAWMVDWHGARAYAAWRAERDGVPWRLPWEFEWEKAARGVDGRAWPWGDFADPTWACVHGSREGRPMPASVGAHPVDTSIYGMRGAAGNVCDWVLDVFTEEGTEIGADGRFDQGQPVPGADDRSRCVKGGSWSNPVLHGRAAFRDGRHPGDRRWVIGFRLARSL